MKAEKKFKRGDRLFITLNWKALNYSSREFKEEHKEKNGIWTVKRNCYYYDDDIYLKSEKYGNWWLPLSDCDIVLLEPLVKNVLPEELFKI
mgnify:CR=1 FL=1|jgi:hypothetical protein